MDDAVHTLQRMLDEARRRSFRVGVAVRNSLSFWLRCHDRRLLDRFDRGFFGDGAEEAEDTPEDRRIVERVVRAYRRAKKAQDKAPRDFAVGPLWEGMIERNFASLRAAVEAGDLDRVSGILQRFQRSRCSLWAGGSFEDLAAARRRHWFRYQFINTWRRYVAVYQTVGGSEEQLSFSQVGRPAGMLCHHGVVPLEAVRYHYWAQRMRALFGRLPRPVVCEIGGGLGGQAYKMLDAPGSSVCYLDFDIPETLLIASYFLLRSLPELHVLLFGEGVLDEEALKKYDLILMPHFELPELPDGSVDLVFNACSLSEMLDLTARAYLRQVERICTGWFLHINHTVRFQWQVGDCTLCNLPADELVPDPERFVLEQVAPRPFGREEDRYFLRQRNGSHQVYLYRRTGPANQERGPWTGSPTPGDPREDVRPQTEAPQREVAAP